MGTGPGGGGDRPRGWWGQAPAGEQALKAAFEVDAEGADAGGRVGERWIAVVGDERVGSGDGNAGILLVLRRD